jgi:hypothetical protein
MKQYLLLILSLLYLFLSSTNITAIQTTQHTPQILVVNPTIIQPVYSIPTPSSDHSTTFSTTSIPQFSSLGSSGTDKRSTAKIAGVLTALLAFGFIMTGVLCLRHRKVACWAPPPKTAVVAAPTNVAQVAIDATPADSAPDNLRKQRAEVELSVVKE